VDLNFEINESMGGCTGIFAGGCAAAWVFFFLPKIDFRWQPI
jgi:hypothetical protein